MPAQPSPTEIPEAAIDRRLRGVHTCAFGTIVSYDAGTYTATVQLAEIDGVEPDPSEDVPVLIPGAWAAGDPVLCVFSEEVFDADLASTGDKRRHGLNPVAIPLIARAGQATDFVALAQLVLDQLNALKDAINGWTPVANDGGAALKTALSSLFVTWPASVAAEKVRAR